MNATGSEAFARSESSEVDWLDPNLVGDYVRWTEGDRTVLVLSHCDLKKYEDVELQKRIMKVTGRRFKASCLCKSGGEEVRSYLRAGYYVTAALQHTATKHRCTMFSQGGHPKGYPIAPIESIKEASQKKLRVRLPLNRLLTALGADRGEQSARSSLSYQREAVIEIVTMIQEIFSLAECLRWDPVRVRTDIESMNAIRAAVNGLNVNELPLSENLHVAHFGEQDPADHLKAELSGRTRPGAIPLHYLLARAGSLSITPNNFHADGYLKVDGFEAPFRIHATVLAELRRSWWREYCRLKSKYSADSQVIVLIALCLEEGNLVVDSLTPHMMSPQWILVQSRKEARFTNQAALEGLTIERSFRKDKNGLYIADLHIMFNGVRILAEVWGLTSAKYREDMREKREYMLRNNILFIEWDAAYERSVPKIIPLILAAIERAKSSILERGTPAYSM